MRYNQSQNSSFWLGDGFFDNDRYDMLGEEIEAKPKGKDPMKLAGYRRAIGNFVRIVTGEPIPVRFNISGDSYTDGETVVISASLKDKDFDSAVGLALHEGSHIKLTDFNTLKSVNLICDRSCNANPTAESKSLSFKEAEMVTVLPSV